MEWVYSTLLDPHEGEEWHGYPNSNDQASVIPLRRVTKGTSWQSQRRTYS